MNHEPGHAGRIDTDGVPRAIALTPILGARYRLEHLKAIRLAAPGAALVAVTADGHAQEPLDDVEVVLCGRIEPWALDWMLARSPRLRWIHSIAAGVEHILTPAVRARGVVVTNARGVFSRPIAEYVLLMIMAVSRRLPELGALQAERTWQPLAGREMRELTVGIVGFGSLGRAVAELAAACGCRVMATRRRAEPGPGETDPEGIAVLGADRLADLLAASDFVVLAAPLTPETDGLIDAIALEAMKPTAWLVNVARGRLVDELALVRAIEQGLIGGAVLDAFREEPLPAGSPLWDMPNVIVTPGMAWSSGLVLGQSVELFCDNLRRYAAGDPLANVVDPAAGY
ncbi:MAG: D-2-hydroxyacid dehydrogenase [Chloroflexi bacterium]|jgi:phosphoglycerate dehydrogenase-like enzyme|nr:D-2-hydroxyacid dehydrogenase [Chloroflexota bacterium]